jgi:hypothetical protein
MNPYIININKKYIASDDPIFVIDKDSMQLYYDIETGFKRQQDQADYIF